MLVLPEPEEGSNPSWFGFILCVKDGAVTPDGQAITRNAITAALEKNNIQTRLLFSGNIIKHPCFDEYRDTDAYRVSGSLDTTDKIMRDAFWIGVYPGLSDRKIDYMSEVIIKACGK